MNLHKQFNSTRLGALWPWVAYATIACSVQPAASAQATQRVSMTANGVQYAGGGVYSLSGDGRYAVTIVGDTYSTGQLYRRDTATGAMQVVSQSSSGDLANDNSGFDSWISDDGTVVAFASLATNLVPFDQNGAVMDVFTHDFSAGVTEVVSVDSFGIQGNANTQWSSISSDGRYVAMVSYSTNLVALDTNQGLDVFLRDRLLGLTTRVSVSSTGAESHYPPTCGNPSCYVVKGVSISGDGRYVAFGSWADNLVQGDTNQADDVFVRDTWTGTTRLVSHTVAGTVPLSWSQYPRISLDGQFIAFESNSWDLLPGTPMPIPTQIFIEDRLSGVILPVSVNNAGQLADGICFNAAPSSDSRYVAFASVATNLVTPDSNGLEDVFLRDVQAGTTTRISNSLGGGVPDNYSGAPFVSGDGSRVAFISMATDIVAGDTNGAFDAFLVDLTLSAPPITTYCTGKTNSQGCVPSIAPAGLPSISGQYAFFVSATKVLKHRVGALAWGLNSAQLPFMGGTLCVQPMRITMPQDSHQNTVLTGGCTGWHSFQFTPPWMLARGWAPGTTVYCQYLCRDPALAAPNKISLSNALQFTVLP